MDFENIDPNSDIDVLKKKVEENKINVLKYIKKDFSDLIYDFFKKSEDFGKGINEFKTMEADFEKELQYFIDKFSRLFEALKAFTIDKKFLEGFEAEQNTLIKRL